MPKAFPVHEKIKRDLRYRIVICACISLAFNLSYAAYNAFLGLRFASLWFTVIFLYYSVLSLMRFYAVTAEFKEKRRRTEISVMRFCGKSLCFLSLVLAAMVYISVTEGHASYDDRVVLAASAAYTLWKALRAAVNMIRVRKRNSPLLTSLRNISFADAAASVFSFEYSLMAALGQRPGGSSAVSDIITGTAACFTVYLLGVGMAV